MVLVEDRVSSLLGLDSYREMDLSGLDLRGIDFSVRNHPITAEEQRLIDATLELLRQRPHEEDPRRSELRMPGRDFFGVNLTGTNFEGANLSGCNLACVQGERVNFRGANLSGAMLPNVRLQDCDFTDVDLSGATFT